MRLGSAVSITLALILFCCGAPLFTAAKGPRAQYLDSYVWHIDKPWFGGWSGIEMFPDGRKMAVITDQGHLLTARLFRDDDHQISAVQPGRMRRLKASSGKFLMERTTDAEGLVLSSDGQYFVSFEGVARVARYATPTSAAVAMPRPKDFRGFKVNRALEALAMDASGHLYAVPEIADDRPDDGNNDGGEISVYVLKGGVWSVPFTLPGGSGYLPVGADFGPDGQFYLLERGWNIFGFRTRLRRWTMMGGQPRQEELLIETRTGTHDNLEGVSIWRDTRGRTRITMIADDNFMFFQRTELVEYAITE